MSTALLPPDGCTDAPCLFGENQRVHRLTPPHVGCATSSRRQEALNAVFTPEIAQWQWDVITEDLE
jgi:hypothetical protein